MLASLSRAKPTYVVSDGVGANLARSVVLLSLAVGAGAELLTGRSMRPQRRAMSS